MKAGAELAFASPKGGVAPLDPASVEMFKDESSVNFLNNHKNLWETTKPLSDFADAADKFDAVFCTYKSHTALHPAHAKTNMCHILTNTTDPGGHGPMFDLATDAASQKLIADFASKGKVVSAVCHGPAVFVNVKLADGTHLLKDKEVTGFSNVEEDQVQLSSAMPFMLETELDKASGGKYVKAAEPWGEKVVVAGNVITGQNPASAHAIGEAIVKALKA